ncbi:hypothetical protein FRC12_002132 [Ceratobasidium sp. 428]|nr:hypothetical protein FRC12_002132 [Ceratobasidium sp. 428]
MGQALGGNAVLEDPDDEPGLEMAKGARVWKVYVKETDRWDKEMSEAEHTVATYSSLDAALFSAVSTAFIIESLKDLKEDYTKSSAEALLALSRKLDTISTGHPTTPLSVQGQGSNPDTFSPPHASVIVNILWLLSLSLSVAVSLIAMLAKGWCYKFLIGRSGQAYEQGRRRQQKWNGMEKWRMQEVLTHLPGLMHIALLLFAVGLCIYLWNVNRRVAIPVVVIASAATFIYMIVTVLPWFDQFCPYSTPATSISDSAAALWPKVYRIFYSMLDAANHWAETSGAGWPFARRVVRLIALCLWVFFWGPLSSVLEHLRDWIKPTRSRIATQSEEDAYTPMDTVTSQMLAWMIVNCEDSHSVNAALEAISGARVGLPHVELAKNGALELMEAQLQACVQKDASLGEYRPKNVNTLYPALRYGRAYSMLALGSLYQFAGPSAVRYRDDIDFRYVSSTGIYDVARIQTDLTRYAESVSANSGVLATAWAGCVQLSHRKGGLDAGSLATFLSRHISGDGTQISEPALLSLLESCPYYMIGRWPLEKDLKQSPLPCILVRIFLMYQDTAPAIAHTIAITLATAAFAVDTYPAGEQPTEATEDRENRAVQVLRHYQKVKSTTEQVDAMLTFGLIGLLPHMSIEALKTSSVARLSKLYDVVTRTLKYPWYGIFTLPESYNWSAHLTSSHQHFTPKTTVDPAFLFSDTASLDALLLRAQLHHDRSFVSALSLLYSEQSKELQDACIDALILQPVAGKRLQLAALREYESRLRMLLNSLFASNRPLDFVVTFYFKLLVATVMLCGVDWLPLRQLALGCLVDCHDEFKQLTPTLGDSELPSEDRILEHVAEPIDGGDKHADHLLHTMQLVVDFCHASPNKLPHIEPDQAGSKETASWVANLQKIKDRFDSTLRPNPAGAANPCRLPYV